jgi:hypothetical protein
MNVRALDEASGGAAQRPRAEPPKDMIDVQDLPGGWSEIIKKNAKISNFYEGQTRSVSEVQIVVFIFHYEKAAIRTTHGKECKVRGPFK